MPTIKDRDRIESVALCELVHALVLANRLGPDPGADPLAAQCEIVLLTRKLNDLMCRAVEEPLAGLRAPDRERVVRNARRLSTAISREWEGQATVKIALALHYLLETLIEDESFDWIDGTPFTDALAILFKAYVHASTDPVIDASARKQARRVLQFLRGQGFFLAPAQPQLAQRSEVAIHA